MSIRIYLILLNNLIVIMALVLGLALSSRPAHALGECGLSCCLAGANSSGVMLAENFGLTVQYEFSDMKTIRHGTDEISPVDVIDLHWTSGGRYSVPTKMEMEKLSFIGAIPLNERWTLVGVVPYIRNNMDMLMKTPTGMLMLMPMETISGLGDVSLLGFYTAYTDAPVRPKERLTFGIGIKAPTGKNDERMANGNLVHAMMQPGSGSWDGLFTLNYMRAWYPVVVQGTLFYHLTTEGDEGYEFGDQLGLDVMLRYQAGSYTNIGIDLNALRTAKDVDHDGQYSRPAMSMVDNTAYTGLTSVSLTPVLQYKIPNTGGSLEIKYQVPIYQDVNGYQQVLDRRWLASLSWVW